MSAELSVRPYEKGDEVAILRAHERVFGKQAPGQRAKSLALWRWQFEQNPSGSRIVVAVAQDGEVRAQYAGLRQRVRSSPSDAHFTQAIDSLHARGLAPGLAHASAFVRAGQRFLESFCGAEADKDQLVYGLAIPAAWRIGSRQLGYQHLRTVSALAARVEECAGAAVLDVVESEHCPVDIAELYAAIAAEREVLALRDVESLDWRFARHPEQRYVFGAVRDGSTLRGLGVFRRGRFAGLEGGLVCEWLVPAADLEAQQALLGWFRAQTEASGARQVIALFPDTAPEWLAFQRSGFRVVPTEYILAVRSFRSPFERDYLFWRWFYTLADTDLV